MSVTSEFYLARAAEAAREAETTTLGNVRERHLRSEAAWRSMAERLVHGEAMREALAVEKSKRDDI